MKRQFPLTSDDNMNGGNEKRQCPSAFSATDPTSTTDSQTLMPSLNQNNDPQSSEAAALPSTSASALQARPWFTASVNRGTDSSQIPFGMRNPWNMMYGMPVLDPNMNVKPSGLFNHDNTVVNNNSAEGRSSSPLPAFTPEEVSKVREQLKCTNSLRDGLKVLLGWLQKLYCNKDNNDDFIALIKNAHNQVWRLMSEKTSIKDELNKEKSEFTKEHKSFSSQLQDILKVHEASNLQKVWDHFTKAQRKNLMYYKEEVQRHKKTFKLDEDEEVDDEVVPLSPDSSQDQEEEELKKECQKLKLELIQLQNQVQTKIDENNQLEIENGAKVNVYKNTVKGLEETCLSFEKELTELQKFKKDPAKFTQPLSRRAEISFNRPNSTGIEISEFEITLLTLISTFLYVHPFGASIDYIYSYLIKFAPDLETRSLENLLRKFPTVFKEESHGIGASLTKDWVFCGIKEKL